MYSIFASVIAPTLPPSNVVLMRSHDGTSMIITWDPITLEQARGFFQYRITLSASTDRRQRTTGRIIDLPFNVTSYNVTGLDPQLTYSVSIGAAVYNESAPGGISDGPTSHSESVPGVISTSLPTASSAAS